MSAYAPLLCPVCSGGGGKKKLVKYIYRFYIELYIFFLRGCGAFKISQYIIFIRLGGATEVVLFLLLKYLCIRVRVYLVSKDYTFDLLLLLVTDGIDILIVLF